MHFHKAQTNKSKIKSCAAQKLGLNMVHTATLAVKCVFVFNIYWALILNVEESFILLDFDKLNNQNLKLHSAEFIAFPKLQIQKSKPV